MNKLWTDDGWADYLYWQSQMLNRVVYALPLIK